MSDLALNSTAFMDNAACIEAGPYLFTQDHYRNPRDAKDAKAWCAICPVQADCLNYALDNRIEDGIYGGTTPNERARILKGRVA